jgi:hypothetical protein
MSTPIAGTDSTLFEPYLNDWVVHPRSVTVFASGPGFSATVSGDILTREPGTYYFTLESKDQLTRIRFSLHSVKSMGHTTIFLKA